MKGWRLATGLLLVGLVLWPAAPVHAQSPVQLWVDDDYCAVCTNDGHVWRANAFSSISAAIHAAGAGGIIHVLPGRYREDVVIDRPCTLQGEGPGKVELMPRASDVTLIVAANDTVVQGLEISGGRQAGILVLGPAFQREPIRRVAIRQNVLRGGLFGVAVNIDSSWAYGLLPALDVEIRNNTVTGCTRAIYVYNSQAAITGNRVAELRPEGIGIYSSAGSVSEISDNTVQVEAGGGQAIYILDNRGTRIDRNTLVGSTEIFSPTTGLALYNYADLALSNNTVRGFYWGATGYTGGSARITSNTFDGAVAWALSLGTAITHTETLIQDNVIRGSYWGLRLDDDGGYGLQAAVQGNQLADNVVGILLGASVQREQVRIHGNDLCGNLVAGLRNESSAPVDAAENWWGANDGPGPVGSGDRIEGAGGAMAAPWMYFAAVPQTLPGGRVIITASLRGSHYALANREMTFATDSGTFAETHTAGRSLRTDGRGEAQATLLPLHSLATVSIRLGCGPALVLRVR